MYQTVRKNFEEKVSYIARMVSGMTVTDQNSYLSVDCGLPSDTFNVLVVRDVSAPAQMLANVDRFTSKGFPLAVWFWGTDIDQADRSAFIQHRLSHAEINTAMYADLSELQIALLHIEGLAIKQVVTASDLFVGSATVGVYDVATSNPYRRIGIGSAMFQHLLKDACTYNRRFCVLQASQDGLGIYIKAGFRPVGVVHVFEHHVVR